MVLHHYYIYTYVPQWQNVTRKNIYCLYTVSEMADIRSMFTSQRSQLPPCFIATPLHRDSSPLTSPSPSFPVFHRLCLLAKESLGVLSGQLISPDLPTADIKASILYFTLWTVCLLYIYVHDAMGKCQQRKPNSNVFSMEFWAVSGKISLQTSHFTSIWDFSIKLCKMIHFCKFLLFAASVPNTSDWLQCSHSSHQETRPSSGTGCWCRRGNRLLPHQKLVSKGSYPLSHHRL